MTVLSMPIIINDFSPILQKMQVYDSKISGEHHDLRVGANVHDFCIWGEVRFMRHSKALLAAAATSLFGGAAFAQSFTYDVVWEPVDFVGGLSGPNGEVSGGAGIVNGRYTTKFDDGSTEKGTVRCIGQDQPDNALFDLHLSCDTKDSSGTASLIYGCNYIGEPGPETPLGCVGGIEGKTGEAAKRRGGLTMEWYSTANARGTGQWYGSK